MAQDISKFGKGGLSQPLSIKDYRLELAPSAVVLPKKFSLRDKIGKIKHQNGSSSCVSQAVSYYAEVLNTIETGEKTALSPRFLYPYVAVDGGGSYIKDNMKRVCEMGIAPESVLSSYENGNPPSEAYMLKKDDITPEIENIAKTYVAKKYLTWDNTSLDLYKKAITNGNGCVVISWGNNEIWKSENIQLPSYRQQMTWQHGIYFIGYDDDKKCFEIVNTWGNRWGEIGFAWLPYKYATDSYLTNPWTMIDLPNDTYVKVLSQLLNLYKKIINLWKK